MSIICDQDWEEMIPTLNGRYCDLCRKEVHDFTDKSIAEIRNASKNTQEMCGRFTADQVNPSIVSQINSPKQLRIVAIVSTLFLSVFAKTAYSQIPKNAETEQVDQMNKKTTKDSSFVDCDSNSKSLNNNTTSKKPFMITRKKKYYWTTTFPFVKRESYPMPRFTGRFL